MFARLFQSLLKKKPTPIKPISYTLSYVPALPEQQAAGENTIEMATALLDHIHQNIAETLDIDASRVNAFANHLNKIESRKTSLGVIEKATMIDMSAMSKNKIYLYFMAANHLHNLIQSAAHGQAGKKAARKELISINQFLNNVNTHFRRREQAIEAYKNYIKDRRRENKKENSVIKYARKKLSEFSARHKISAAKEMMQLLGNPDKKQKQLSDESINALVHGRLGLLTERHADAELHKELRLRYNSKTRTCEVKGLQIVMPGRVY